MTLYTMNWLGTLTLLAPLTLAACGADDSDAGGSSSGAAGGSTSAGGSAAGGSGGAGGSVGGSGAGGGAGTGAGGSSGSGGAGAGAGTAGSAGAAGAGAAGAAGASGGVGGAGGGDYPCDTVRDSLLGPIDMVSTGEVIVVDDTGGVVTLYVDASAGGFMAAAQNPWIYLNLEASARVDLTDPAALAASSWDLALKRDVIRTNSDDSGPGAGAAAALVGADFDAVTGADAASASFVDDDYIDALTCMTQVDQTGKPLTAFNPWYDYDPSSMQLTPRDVVYLVYGADGTSLFKLELLGYYAEPDGGLQGVASARYLLRYAAL